MQESQAVPNAGVHAVPDVVGPVYVPVLVANAVLVEGPMEKIRAAVQSKGVLRTDFDIDGDPRSFHGFGIVSNDRGWVVGGSVGFVEGFAYTVRTCDSIR